MSETREGGRGCPSKETYRNLKMAIFDVDGVLTDGRIIMDENGKETKFFDVRDATGMTFLRHAEFQLAMISGRVSGVTDARARNLKIAPEFARHGIKYKLPAFREMIASAGVQEHECAFFGDDIIDLPVLRVVGVACCPGDARPEVIQESHVVATSNGGRGAVRQLCEHLLKAREDGTWEAVLEKYLDPKS